MGNSLAAIASWAAEAPEPLLPCHLWVLLILGRRCYSIGGRHIQIALSVVCFVLYCDQTVLDRPIVCIKVE